MLGDEEAEERGGNGEGRTEDDADVTERHAVLGRMVADDLEVGREEAEEHVVLRRQEGDEPTELVDLIREPGQVARGDERGLEVAGEDVRGQFAEERLEQTGDGVRIKVLARAEQVVVALCGHGQRCTIETEPPDAPALKRSLSPLTTAALPLIR